MMAGGMPVSTSHLLTSANPHPAAAVGIAAGVLSTVGYTALTPALERCCGITDTCGVANLHGTPGVLGGLVSALFAYLLRPGNDALIVHGARQPAVQLAALGCTLAAAAVGGLAAGWLVNRVDPARQSLDEDELFEDAPFWHGVEKED